MASTKRRQSYQASLVPKYTVPILIHIKTRTESLANLPTKKAQHGQISSVYQELLVRFPLPIMKPLAFKFPADKVAPVTITT
jgi:hypothetical protein